ncbi:hypothetical protein CMI37_33225 [Candidatus Pacearchaeota archaeon]|nr:hypothetical protein [Candidatus Pacearchaeota archaeon]
MHYTRWRNYGSPFRVKQRSEWVYKPPITRFWPKIKLDPTTECWDWTASKSRDGYGCFKVGRKILQASRFSYTHFVGTIPFGLEIDHLCHNRSCVNPKHLEPVTKKVNGERQDKTRLSISHTKTHCLRGYPYIEENIWRDRKGIRYCRACSRFRDQRRRSLFKPLLSIQPRLASCSRASQCPLVRKPPAPRSTAGSRRWHSRH